MVPFAPAPSHLLDALLAPYELLRRVGSRPSPLYVVRHAAPGGKPKLFVAERFEGVAQPGAEHWATFNAEARRISTLAGSNVARVRELSVRGSDLVAFWEFIDGEKLIETWLTGVMPLEVSLRIVIDTLTGAGAIHALRDAKQQPMDMAHGELSTATVVLGVDGTARVLHAIARRLPGARPEKASIGYLAPEVHAGEFYGAPADVFSAGVLLWEALSGRRLFPEDDAAAILARVRGGGVPLAHIPDDVSWARPLATVAARALASAPEGRWPSTTAMAAEIRKVAGFKLASAVAAAAFAKDAIGERVRVRRQALESGVDPAGATIPAEIVPVLPLPAEALVTSPEAAAAENAREQSGQEAPDAPPIPGVDTSGAHDFAAAIDVPLSIASPLPDPFEVSPTSSEATDSFEPNASVTRRRRVAVLGGVGALGLIVFVLAGWRVAHRDTLPPTTDRGRLPPAAATRPSRPPSLPARPMASSSSSASPAATTSQPTPSTAVAASHTPRSPTAASPSGAPRPSSAPQKPSSQPHSKPKSNSGYDPGAL